MRDPRPTRAALLDAALVEFSENGRAGARTSAIAARAGVNKQLISHHFGGKDGLYAALVARWEAEEAATAARTSPLATSWRAYVGGGRAAPRPAPAPAPRLARGRRGRRRRRRRRPRRHARAARRPARSPTELDPAFVLLALQAVAAAGLSSPAMCAG